MTIRKDIAVVTTVFAMIVLSACAARQGPILVDSSSYVAPQGLAPSATKVVVGISPFKDERNKKTSLIGERVKASGEFENDLVIQGTVSDMVMAGFKEAMKARGIVVKDIPAWDLNIGNLQADGADIVVGGSITALWAKAVTDVLNAKTRADVALHVVAADAREKKGVRTLDISGMFERQDLGFGEDRVGQALSAALSSAIDQLLNDSEFRKTLQ